MNIFTKIFKDKTIYYFLLLVSAYLMFNFVNLLAKEKDSIDNNNTSKVYFSERISDEAVIELYQKINGNIQGKVGLKVHFGEKGNTYYVRPQLFRSLQKETNASFVETNVIYPGPRQRTNSHIALAKEHGFGYAPIDILDRTGQQAKPFRGKHFNEVFVGNGFDNYDSYIICSHFKGHAMAGFGGAIKNVAMGLGSAKGKTAMHSSHYPAIDADKCINCGLCVKSCAEDAIALEPLRIDATKCVGCGKCIAECPVKALTNQKRKNRRNDFLEKLADYAKGISDHSNMVYINFVNNVSPDCDCMSHPEKPFVHDIGVLASTDPIALDKACLDLVNKAADSEDAFLEVNTISGLHQLSYGEKIGLGNLNYELISIDE
jgi:uncharacterized Fe-S center protein